MKINNANIIDIIDRRILKQKDLKTINELEKLKEDIRQSKNSIEQPSLIKLFLFALLAQIILYPFVHCFMQVFIY